MNSTTLPSSERIRDLLHHMGEKLFEKERILALTLLSAIAGESIFLLGPPGVAKSMIARRLKLAFQDAKAFEYLMGKFSTPDEVFGPVSISRLKNEDKYERMTEHYLPGAQVVFLDEIWKASPPIQNALLTVLNEKIYRNGEQEIRVDIRGLISASNELPNEGEGLEALWDRFLIRVLVEGIASEQAFEQLLALPYFQEKKDPVPQHLKISDEEYQGWQQGINEVTLPTHLIYVIHEIRHSIRHRNSSADPDDQWYISDRRWRKSANLLRTSALLNGRTAVSLSDLALLIDCIWDRFEQREIMADLVIGVLVSHGYERLTQVGSVRARAEFWQKEIEEETHIVTLNQVIRPKLSSDEQKQAYVELPSFRGSSTGYLRKEDWDLLQGKEEIIFPLFEKREGEYKPVQRVGGRQTDNGKIRIAGQEYEVTMEEAEEKEIMFKQPEPRQIKSWNEHADFLLQQCDHSLATLNEHLKGEQQAISSHLFIPSSLKNPLEQAQVFARRQILDLKLDIEQTRHTYEQMGES